MIVRAKVQGFVNEEQDAVSYWQSMSRRKVLRTLDPPHYTLEAKAIEQGVRKTLLNVEGASGWQIDLNRRMLHGAGQKAWKPTPEAKRVAVRSLKFEGWAWTPCTRKLTNPTPYSLVTLNSTTKLGLGLPNKVMSTCVLSKLELDES